MDFNWPPFFAGGFRHRGGGHRLRREDGLGLLGREAGWEDPEAKVLRPQLRVEQANEEVDQVIGKRNIHSEDLKNKEKWKIRNLYNKHSEVSLQKTFVKDNNHTFDQIYIIKKWIKH